MNVLPAMLPALDDLKKRFAELLDAVHAPRANEIYVHAKMDLVAGFTACLYHQWQARLVSLFADDARVAQTSKSAVSRVSKPAGTPPFQRSADLEIGDTAGLETCATPVWPESAKAAKYRG